MLNHVNNMNHEAAHLMIQALSMTDEGHKLVKALEDIRYYHRAADVYDLGYGGILVEAFPGECRPVACTVDSLTQMAVTAPVDQVNLPGLTKDKWAHKKAAEADAERRDTSWDFPSLIMPGYIQDCATVYGVNINRIDCLDVWPTPFEDCTPETICDEKSWSYREPAVLRAACQTMSELRHWEYFDKCSPLQCAKHLFANDFRPVDL